MSVVALLGDCTTTAALALASTWHVDDVIVLEADPSGGSLCAWLDTPTTPSLSSAVAQSHDARAERESVPLDSISHRSASGVRFIAAPIRARAATRAITEANTTLFSQLATETGCTIVADLGRHRPAERVPVLADMASTIVVVHRQDSSSAAAATARVERLAESVESLTSTGAPILIAVIGDRPFDRDEIATFVSIDVDAPMRVLGLADDPLSAAVFAGRTGVSAKRLARLPLMRSARRLAAAVEVTNAPRRSSNEWPAPHETAS